MSKSKEYQHSAKWNRKNLDEWEWETFYEIADALRSGLSETGAESAIEELLINRYGEAYVDSPVGKHDLANAVRIYLERK